MFVFWRSGTLGLLPTLRCLFVFLFGCFAPLLCLFSSWWLWLAIVLCCWSLLLVFLFWRPVASARPGVFLLWRLGLVFLLIGVLGLGLPWAVCFPLVVVVGVCLLALWDFCPPCGVRLPLLGGCGLGLVFVFRLFGVSARSGVFIFPLVVVVGALGLLPALLCFFPFWLLWWAFVLCWSRPSARSIFSFSSLGHLKLAGRTCNDAWLVLSELVCRSAGGGVFPGCSYCREPPQQQHQHQNQHQH